MEVDRLADVVKGIDELERKINRKFEEMGRGFDQRLVSVVWKMVSRVVAELVDLSYGKVFKEIWRPEEMELEEEEYRGLDWRTEVGELRAEAIEAGQGGRVREKELERMLEEFEEFEEEEEEEEEEYKDREDDSGDGYLEGGRDLEATSLSGEE